MLKRGLSFFIAFTIAIGVFPIQVNADEEPEYLNVEDGIEDYLEDGDFYFGSQSAEFPENATHGYLLKVARKGNGEGEAKVKVTFTDYSAKYGTDYKIAVYQSKEKVENTKESLSVAEVISQAEDMEVTDSSDAVVSGENPNAADPNASSTVDAEQIVENYENLSDEENEQLDNVVNSFYDVFDIDTTSTGTINDVEETEKTEEIDDSLQTSELAKARSEATGLASDKVAMETGNTSIEEQLNEVLMSQTANEKIVDELSEELNSVYVDLDFSEGETEKYIEFKLKDNSISDGDRFFTANLSAGDDDTTISDLSGFQAKIIDDEEGVPSTVSFSESTYYPEEGYIKVKLVREGSISDMATVNLTTSNGSATSGEDYSKVNATVSFLYGLSERTVNIPIRSDYLEDETADFNLTIDNPVNCEIGLGNATAVISQDDASYLFEDNALNSEEAISLASMNDVAPSKIDTISTDNQGQVRVGDEISFPHVVNVDYSSALSYSRMVDDHLELHVEAGGNARYHEVDGHSSVIAQARIDGFNSSSDAHDNLPRYDYDGIVVDWEKTSSKPSWNGTYVGFNNNNTYDSYDWITYDERWNRKTTAIYSNQRSMYSYSFGAFKWIGFGATTKVYSVRPILRAFDVSLLQADPLKFVDSDGTLKSSDKIAELRNISETYLNNANASGVSTLYSGDSITVELKNKDYNPIYLKGIAIVNADGEEKILVDDLSENTDSYSIQLNNDFLYENDDYVTYKETNKKGLSGSFSIKPILGYKDLEVTIDNSDKRGYVEALHCQQEAIKDGNTITYHYHRGDYVLLKQYINDEYKGVYKQNSITIKPSQNTARDQSFNDGSNGYGERYLNETKLEIKPNFVGINSSLVVRVKKNEIDQFKTYASGKGDAKLKTVLDYPKVTEDDEYVVYNIADKNHFIANHYYELYADTKDSSYVPVWSVDTSKDQYAQNSFALQGNIAGDSTVVNLTLQKADETKYAMSANISYSEARIGNSETKVGWSKASGVVLSTGYNEKQTNITDDNGDVVVGPIQTIQGYRVQYKINYSGKTEYSSILVDGSNESSIEADGESCQEIKLNDLVISSYNTSVPYISSFVAKRISGTETVSTNEVVIDDTEVILNAYISNDGATYTDSEGNEHVEKVKGVDFYVYDGTSHEEKFYLGAGTQSESDSNTWSLNYVFNAGESMKYQPSDMIFAKVTTDRIVGKGGVYDLDGNYAEKTFLKETVYSAVNTGYVFSQNDYVQPAEQNLVYQPNIEVADLPYIGRINMDINLKYLHFSMAKLEDGGMRFSIGVIPKEFGNNITQQGYVSDTGEVITKENFKSSFDDMATTIRESSATVNQKSTFFAPTVIQAKPFIGFYIDFKYTFVQDDAQEANVRKVLSCAGGGAFVGGSLNVRKAFYMLIGYVPVYIGGDVSAGILLELGMRKQYATELTYDQMLNNNAIDEEFFDFRLRAYAYMSLYVGAGVCGTIGVRGGINYYPNLIWTPTITKTHPNYRELGYTHKFYLKLWADAVFFSMPIVSVPINSWNVDLGYFEDVENDVKNAQEGTVLTSLSNEDTEVKEVSETSEWLGDETSFRASWGTPVSTTLSENGYDNNYQQLIDIGNNRIMMVFVDSRENNTYPLEQTVLQYSIYDGDSKKWSKPVVIDGDGTADLYPSVCKTGENKITVTWMSHEANEVNTEYQKTKEEIDALSEEEYNDLQKNYLKAQDIYTIDIDTNTLQTSNKTRITSDEYFNSTPMITYDSQSGKMLVYYYKSDVTDNFMTSVNPTLNGATLAFMLYDSADNTWKQVDKDGIKQQVQSISEFTDKMNGQSFVPLSTSEHQDPIIYDLDVTTFNGKGYYAFTVDEDNNLQTSEDRHLYLGIYDFKENKFIYSGRVTTTNGIGETSPKFAVNNNTCYLFWNNQTGQINFKAMDDSSSEDAVTFLYEIEHDGKTVDFKDNNTSGSGTYTASFQYGSIFSASDIPTITGYEPFVDNNGDLYVAYTQNVSDDNVQENAFNAEVFVTAMINNGKDNVCWSGGVQLTDTGAFNETPVIAATSENNLVVVNSQYQFSSKDEEAEITDKKLISTEFSIVPSLNVEDLTYATNYEDGRILPKAKDQVSLNLSLKNSGVIAASGYKVEITPFYDGQVISTYSLSVENKTDTILPSSIINVDQYSDGESIIYTIPEIVKDVTKLSFNVKTTEYDTNGNKIGKSVSQTFSPFESNREYKISDIETEQTNTAIYLKGTLKNTGNVATNTSDTINVSFNDYYFESGKYVSFGKQQVEELQPGETQKFEIQLDVDDSYFKYGSVNVNVAVMDEENEMFDGSVNTLVQLETPYKITVNGNDFSESNLIAKMQVGDELELNGTYSSQEYFGGGTLRYASLDTSIVMVEGNHLKAIHAGEATVAVKVDPYGGYQEMVVQVVDQNNDSDINSTPTPTSTPDSKNKKDAVEKEVVDTSDPSHVELYWFLFISMTLLSVALLYFRKTRKVK